MKKTICILLCALMALSLIPAMAMEGDGQLPAPEGGEYLYCFPSGEDLMAATSDALYIWHSGAEAATRVSYDLPELDEDETATVYPFTAGGKLYAIRLVAQTDEDEVDYRHTTLFELTVDGDTAEGEKLDRLSWDDLLVYDDNDRSIALKPYQITEVGDDVLMLCQGNSKFVMAKLDVENVSLDVDTSLEYIRCLTPYKDGKALLMQHTFDSEDISLLLYDPKKEETETLSTFTFNFFSAINGLAYDSEKDVTYICKEGEVCPLDVNTGKMGESIADMPNCDSTNSDTACACVLNGVYTLCNVNLVSRVLYGRPEIGVYLRLNNSVYAPTVDNAVKRFNETHDTVRVTVQRDEEAQNRMLEALVKQDDAIDIYVLDTTMPSYAAVFNRGYLMPLNDSAAVTDLVGQMYPGIQKAITREGSIQVLPARVDANTLGVNLKVLGKLGLSESDIPDNWDAFLDFLPTLAEPLSEHSDIRLMEGAANLYDVRLALLGLIFNDYNYYNTANGIEAPYNADPLRSLANKLGRIDFEALGYEAPADENFGFMTAFGEEGVEYVFSGYAGCTPDSYKWMGYSPFKMRLTPDYQTCMVIDCTMVGVNPYTRHPKEALAFMETVAEVLSPSQRAALIPTYNEIIRGESNEALIRNQRETVAQLEAQLEKASDSNRPLAQAALDQAREDLARYEETAWEISAAGLEWYRAHDANLMPSGVNWLNNEYTANNEQYLKQYCIGKITGEELLAGFDKTADMMRREGN